MWRFARRRAGRLARHQRAATASQHDPCSKCPARQHHTGVPGSTRWAFAQASKAGTVVVEKVSSSRAPEPYAVKPGSNLPGDRGIASAHRLKPAPPAVCSRTSRASSFASRRFDLASEQFRCARSIIRPGTHAQQQAPGTAAGRGRCRPRWRLTSRLTSVIQPGQRRQRIVHGID